jgi:hypothetical protein
MKEMKNSISNEQVKKKNFDPSSIGLQLHKKAMHVAK